jgi:hypothetical protein
MFSFTWLRDTEKESSYKKVQAIHKVKVYSNTELDLVPAAHP